VLCDAAITCGHLGLVWYVASRKMLLFSLLVLRDSGVRVLWHSSVVGSTGLSCVIHCCAIKAAISSSNHKRWGMDRSAGRRHLYVRINSTNCRAETHWTCNIPLHGVAGWSIMVNAAVITRCRKQKLSSCMGRDGHGLGPCHYQKMLFRLLTCRCLRAYSPNVLMPIV